MPAKSSFEVQNPDGRRFTFTTKTGGRIYDSLQALMKGPLPAPSKRRVSDHILKMREAGICIETEMRDQAEEGQEKYGVYHLKSRVTPSPAKQPVMDSLTKDTE